MHGDSRLGYQHYIRHRAADCAEAEEGDVAPATRPEAGPTVVIVPRAPRRLSLTFRTLRGLGDPCGCSFPWTCDSQGGGRWKPHGGRRVEEEGGAGGGEVEEEEEVLPAPSAPLYPGGSPALERSHVHDVYDAISPHFSDTRHARWPAAAAFMRQLTPGSLVADVGCGNGAGLGGWQGGLFLSEGVARSSLPLFFVCLSRSRRDFLPSLLLRSTARTALLFRSLARSRVP